MKVEYTVSGAEGQYVVLRRVVWYSRRSEPPRHPILHALFGILHWVSYTRLLGQTCTEGQLACVGISRKLAHAQISHRKIPRCQCGLSSPLVPQGLLTFKIFLWGVFLMAQGGARNFQDMVALRVVSGACEAVAKPGFSQSTSLPCLATNLMKSGHHGYVVYP